MPSQPLRRILSLQFIGVAIIPFVVMALLFVNWLLPQVSDDVEAQHLALARAIQGQVEGHLMSAKSDVQMIATLLSETRIEHGELQRLLDLQIKTSTTLNTLYGVGLDGRIRVVGIGHDHHEDLHTSLENADFSRNTLISKALEQRTVIWSDALPSIDGGHPTAAVVVPSERIVAIGELSLDHLNQFLHRTGADVDRKIFIIDRHGLVVADRDGLYTKKHLNIGNIPLIRAGTGSSTPRSGRFELEGQEMIGAMIEIPGIRWDILVADPVRVAFRPSITVTRIVVAGLLTALLLGIGTAIVSAYRLSLRFDELTFAARSIAAGSEDAAPIRGGIVEVEGLANDLFRMQHAIRERESQLSESRNLLQAFMDNTFQHQGLLTPDGKVIYINNTALTLIDSTLATVVDHYFWLTPWWSHDPQLQKQLQEAVALCAAGQSIRFDAIHLDREGHAHYVDVSLKPLRDASGTIAYLVTEGHDITERVKLQDALLNEKNFIDTTINSMLGVFYVIDARGRVVRGNDAHRALYGVDDDSYLGREATSIIYPDDKDKVTEKISEVFAHGYGEIEARIVDAHGQTRDFLLNGRRIDIGGTSYIVGTGVDITGKKLIEVALLESEERFTQIFKQNDDALFLVNIRTMEIIDANQAANDLFLIDNRAANSMRHISNYIDGADFEKIFNLMDIDDISKSIHIDRAVCHKTDQNNFYASIWIKILEVGSSHILYCSIRDITSKLEMEEQIKSTQAKLIHTNKMASLGLLVSSVAHEINNPNHCIAINASVLTHIWHDAAPLVEEVGNHRSIKLGGLPLHEALEYVPKLFMDITASSKRINAIIVNMRDFTKSGQPHAVQQVDINNIVTSAVALLWHNITRHTDNFRTHLQEGLPAALGNPQQLEQVIINLLMNALQALPDRNHGISISTACEPSRGDMIITVQDEGKGMDPATLQRLTEPFFTTREEEGGTGLGLYISAMILKDYGGTLSFESIVNRGTVATVRLRASASSA